ncbi:MAG: type III toxin-antitoxin system ToxN/AbiQ family toxin [Clostridia bacterium]|nr:type III toxin-antitoxin system ToxN/AbiQ family toxin [Clostridia bacterium]
MRLDLYTVDSQYFNYLRKFEPRVPYVKEDRPFIGIVLKIHYKNYFAPLGSPKEKHKTMRKQKDLIKIRNGELGVINFNNMIPIPSSRCQKIDIANMPDPKYKILLNDQVAWCNIHIDEIIQTAEKLYYLVCYSDKPNTALRNRCCDFRLLERKCIEYMKVHTLHEEEFLYQVS